MRDCSAIIPANGNAASTAALFMAFCKIDFDALTVITDDN